MVALLGKVSIVVRTVSSTFVKVVPIFRTIILVQSVMTGSPSGTDLVRGWLSSLFARASQFSVDTAETFGLAGPGRALHHAFCVDASSSEDKALMVVSPMRMEFDS